MGSNVSDRTAYDLGLRKLMLNIIFEEKCFKGCMMCLHIESRENQTAFTWSYIPRSLESAWSSLRMSKISAPRCRQRMSVTTFPRARRCTFRCYSPVSELKRPRAEHCTTFQDRPAAMIRAAYFRAQPAARRPDVGPRESGSCSRQAAHLLSHKCPPPRRQGGW